MIVAYLAAGLVCAILSALLSVLAGASVFTVIIAYCMGGFVGVSVLFALQSLCEDTKQARQTSSTGRRISQTPRNKRSKRG
jgi:uncharacterized membrane protein YuzA (DUF378 family)